MKMKVVFNTVVLALLAPLVGACGAPLDGLQLVADDTPGRPLEGLDAELTARFRQGDARFDAPFTAAQGLGPLYVRSACSSCHADDGRGPGVVERLAGPAELLPWGDVVRPYTTVDGGTPVLAPDDPRVRVTRRAPPAVLGRGWIEAIAADEIERVADEQAATGGPISGRVARDAWSYPVPPDARYAEPGSVQGARIGRLGLKARSTDLDGFTADALHGDMGLTSAWLPDEAPNPDGAEDDARPGVDVDDDTVRAIADYVRLLAIPGRAAAEPGAEQLFADVGCATCHVPSLHTRADHPVAVLADAEAPVYTDVLLHEMGADADDGVPEADAGTSEWRTAPLIGLRFQRTFLHDGRATTVLDAVLGHAGPGSEANDVVDAFRALSPDDRDLLVRFVASL
jgi:CxxC motif-containing protein (DUF1111 family)